MGDSVQLELFPSSVLLDDMQGIDGQAPLSEDEWATLFLTLGSSDDSSLFSNEMDVTSTIISTAPETFPFSFPGLPSSPESGSESSLQSSPQTSPYNDFLFSLPETQQSPASMLPSIEPFPPRSPVFEPHAVQIGNIGQPSTEAAAAPSGYARHLGQPLAQLQPALASAKIPFAGNTALTDENASKKPRKAVAGTVRSEIVAATSGVVLPRDTLLKLSSAEMEAYLHALKSSRQLTHDEEKSLKKQLRLIKNREYAQESRKKKKSAHQELEGELTSLRTQNSELRTQNSALQSEVVLLNSRLASVTSENTRLRSALRQMQQFHLLQEKKHNKNANNKRPRSFVGDDDLAPPSSPSSWFALGLGSASVQSPKTVAGGICLLGVAIFALSFLLQGSAVFMGPSSNSMGWTGRVMLEHEQTWPTSPPAPLPSLRPPKETTLRGKGVAKCGYDNMCYLYADKSHHIKTATRDPGGQRSEDAEGVVGHQRQNLTHHAIPVH